ncbi:MAG TPA: acyl-CoA synthetase [Actinomycetota bacterium]
MAEFVFWNHAQKDPDHLALVEPDGTEHTAGELLASSDQLTHGLRALGLKAGDAVAVVLPNSAAMVELNLACMQSGWYLVPLNYHLAAPEIAYIVSDSKAKAMICHERFADKCRQAADEIAFPAGARFSVGSIEGFASYEQLKDDQPTVMPSDRVLGTVMNYTAGTTGRPKGVRRPIAEQEPDGAIELEALFLMLFGIQAHDDNVHLAVSPMYHTAVMRFSMMSLHLGHTVVQMDKWTAEETLRLIDRYKVTTSHMVPTQFHRLLQLPDDAKKAFDVSSLRHMVHSAAPCPVPIKKSMLDWWGPVIDEYYAATEGGGTLATPDEWLKKPGTVGKPWPISEIRILDDDNKPLPPNTPGTVWIKMGDYTFEYHGDRKKTEETWNEGFFTVGDVGYLDEDGYLFLNDRKSDMIISGGVNVYPAEIEAALMTHPKVTDVAVFGIPHDDWGEEIKAVVQPKPGVDGDDALAEDLAAFCREQLAGYKVPRSFDFSEQLPRDPNGKLYKRTLRDPYWEGRDRAI